MLPRIRIVNSESGEDITDNIGDLTQTSLGSLCWECQQLLETLKDAEAAESRRLKALVGF